MLNYSVAELRYNKCSHIDDLSAQIVEKYLKRYDDTIESMKNSSL